MENHECAQLIENAANQLYFNEIREDGWTSPFWALGVKPFPS